MDKNFKDLISYSEQGILSKSILSEGKLDITLFCMSRGTKLAEHTSTKEGFVYVIEGDGVFNLENKDITMAEGVLIPMKENAVHSLRANENTSFLLVLSKS